jgi:hypothetical protein
MVHLAQVFARVCRSWYQTIRERWLERAADRYKGTQLSVRLVKSDWPWVYAFSTLPFVNWVVYRMVSSYGLDRPPLTLSRLTKLSVTQAHGAGTLPSFSGVSQMENLRLSAANYDMLRLYDGDGSPSALSQLRTLSLIGTTRYNVSLDRLSKWPLLRTLKLDIVELSREAWRTLPQLKNLCKLSLSRINVSGSVLATLTGLTALSLRCLKPVDTHCINNDTIGRLTQLQCLSLCDCDLSPTTLLSSFPHLTALSLKDPRTDNTFTAIRLAVDTLGNSLTRLSLSLSRPPRDDANVFSALTRLNRLTLRVLSEDDMGQMTTESFESYKLPVSLCRLSLETSGIEFPHDLLSPLTQLTRLQTLKLALCACFGSDDVVHLPLSLTALTSLTRLSMEGNVRIHNLSQLVTLKSFETSLGELEEDDFPDAPLLSQLPAGCALNGHTQSCWQAALQNNPDAMSEEQPRWCLPACPQHVLNRLTVSAKNQ